MRKLPFACEILLSAFWFGLGILSLARLSRRKLHLSSDQPCIEPLGDALKLRDTVLYLDDPHVVVLRVPSDIFLWVLFATLELITACIYLGGDTHLVVALNLPGARDLTLVFRVDINCVPVGTVMFDERVSSHGAPVRFV
jgi:hypothetical protein